MFMYTIALQASHTDGRVPRMYRRYEDPRHLPEARIVVSATPAAAAAVANPIRRLRLVTLSFASSLASRRTWLSQVGVQNCPASREKNGRSGEQSPASFRYLLSAATGHISPPRAGRLTRVSA